MAESGKEKKKMKMKMIGELGISPWPWECEEGDETHFPVVCSYGESFMDFVCDGGTDKNNANARLISAAPELYDCLHEAVEQSCHECEDDTIEHCRGKCHIARWRDALAKAGGESEVEE